MPISFRKIPQATLDVKSGTAAGVDTKKQVPTIGTMPIPTFHDQITALAQSKTPIEKAYAAIDQHPDIQDRVKAKSMAAAVYDILGSGKKS